MKDLRELISVSSLNQLNGDIGTLAELVAQNKSREEAKKTIGKTDHHFNVIYKNLKDRLMEGVLVNDFKNTSKVQRRQFSIRKQYEESIFLIQSGRMIAGIPSARACMHKAEKNGLFQIALDLSRELSRYFGTIMGDVKKYKYYSERMKLYREELNKELSVEEVYFDLGFHLKNGLSVDGFKIKLEELGKIKSISYRFNYMYFELLALWHRIYRNDEALFQTCEDALNHFSGYNYPLPYVTKWSWYFQQIPMYLANGDYFKAEQCLTRCFEGPEKGTINWYLTWQFRALYGFYSNKPMIAFAAWKKTTSLPKNFRNELMEENWLIIRAYLELLVKSNRIEPIGTWRLNRFLNSVGQSNLEKEGKNISIIIVELLHLLADKKLERYSTRCEKLDDYIKTHLNNVEQSRAKLFLRLLQCIVRGGFKKKEANNKGREYLRTLIKSNSMVSTDVREVEIIPFEMLWEMAIGWL
ncbi:MAG: hypothetical protein R2825_16805 [Saprospiraceae bacterium]